ncbi:hypothetical protein F5Y03DRAFT_375150 [Xylaria venustula]|nr:hypothetical protein F5Y03DRAFT_375150 [Xylaria venustula]
MGSNSTYPVSYSRFACIGAGFSGIGLGATLKRWYGITDIQFFERQNELGGAWYINQYPGCACDIPSVLYSFSFEPNPDWTRILPRRAELMVYLVQVANKYDLNSKMKFGVNVEACEWVEERGVWRLRIRQYSTDEIFFHESQFLFSGSGTFVTPREIDIPGAERFQGPIFHAARWQKDVDLTDKRVIVFGNGCTGAQVVPNIVKKTKSTTQIVHSKHWIMPPIDMAIPKWIRNLLRWVPGSMQMFRFIIFLLNERSLQAQPLTEAGARYRQRQRLVSERYMRKTAPKKYHDVLIPDFEIGCKRRIFDSNYLESLHEENLTLTDSPALEIVQEGVRTKDGIIPADVIVLATGFVTNNFFDKIDIKGCGGEELANHWHEMGGFTAYNSSVVSGFPNFFMLLGPNSATGHASALMAAENSINFALRIIKPILDGKASVVDLKPQAELDYTKRVQDALINTVWNSGCVSWYIPTKEPGKSWNALSYPWSQSYFWFRSCFPTWKDWRYYGEVNPQRSNKNNARTIVVGVLSAVAGWYWYRDVDWKTAVTGFQTVISKQFT